MYRFGERLLSSSMPSQTTATPFSFAMLSHTGRVRKGNEDTVAASADDGAFVICDGMGGAAAGEVASRLAADTFLALLKSGSAAGKNFAKPSMEVAASEFPLNSAPAMRLNSAIHAANQAVFQRARKSPELRGMGTTLVALLLEPSNSENASSTSMTLAHVGDSRCYLYRKGALSLLTHDHSLVEEQLRSGQITALEARHHPMRNIITRAVGSQSTVEADICQLDPRPGDLLLLASDGLTRELSDHALAAILEQSCAMPTHPADRPLDLPRLCQTLIDEANEAGGGDNISVLLLQLSA